MSRFIKSILLPITIVVGLTLVLVGLLIFPTSKEVRLQQPENNQEIQSKSEFAKYIALYNEKSKLDQKEEEIIQREKDGRSNIGDNVVTGGGYKTPFKLDMNGPKHDIDNALFANLKGVRQIGTSAKEDRMLYVCYVWEYLKQKGLSDIHVAGIMGAAMKEGACSQHTTQELTKGMQKTLGFSSFHNLRLTDDEFMKMRIVQATADWVTDGLIEAPYVNAAFGFIGYDLDSQFQLIKTAKANGGDWSDAYNLHLGIDTALAYLFNNMKRCGKPLDPNIQSALSASGLDKIKGGQNSKLTEQRNYNGKTFDWFSASTGGEAAYAFQKSCVHAGDNRSAGISYENGDKLYNIFKGRRFNLNKCNVDVMKRVVTYYGPDFQNTFQMYAYCHKIPDTIKYARENNVFTESQINNYIADYEERSKKVQNQFLSGSKESHLNASIRKSYANSMKIELDEVLKLKK